MEFEYTQRRRNKRARKHHGNEGTFDAEISKEIDPSNRLPNRSHRTRHGKHRTHASTSAVDDTCGTKYQVANIGHQFSAANARGDQTDRANLNTD